MALNGTGQGPSVVLCAESSQLEAWHQIPISKPWSSNPDRNVRLTECRRKKRSRGLGQRRLRILPPHSFPLATDAGIGVNLTAPFHGLEDEMLAAANNLEFEKADLLRDQTRELKRTIDGSQSPKDVQTAKPASYLGSRRKGRRRRITRRPN
jgi:hypothetical protein